MANYYGKARSNYFAVSDEEAFDKIIEPYPLKKIVSEKDGVRRVGIMDNNIDGGGWPMFYDLKWYDGEGNAYDEKPEGIPEGDLCQEEDYDNPRGIVDIVQAIADELLLDGEVIVIQEVGAEKYRYLNGWAYATDNKENEASLNLDDIFETIKEWGIENPTRVQY